MLDDDDSTSCASWDPQLFDDAIEASEDTAADSDASRPDFSGNWSFARYEGDFDDLMQDAGISWSMRKAVRAVDYGVGIVRCTIAQHGDSIDLNFSQGPFGGHVMRLEVGAGEQATLAEDCAPVSAVARWEGSALVIEAKLEKNGAPIQPVRRFLQGDELVAESTTSRGAVVRRFFRRI